MKTDNKHENTKLTYRGYRVDTAEGQKDLFYGGRVDPNAIITKSNKPLATDEDKEILAQKGEAWLEEVGFWGVLDRLKNSNLI